MTKRIRGVALLLGLSSLFTAGSPAAQAGIPRQLNTVTGALRGTVLVTLPRAGPGRLGVPNVDLDCEPTTYAFVGTSGPFVVTFLGPNMTYSNVAFIAANAATQCDTAWSGGGTIDVPGVFGPLDPLGNTLLLCAADVDPITRVAPEHLRGTFVRDTVRFVADVQGDLQITPRVGLPVCAEVDITIEGVEVPTRGNGVTVRITLATFAAKVTGIGGAPS